MVLATLAETTTSKQRSKHRQLTFATTRAPIGARTPRKNYVEDDRSDLFFLLICDCENLVGEVTVPCCWHVVVLFVLCLRWWPCVQRDGWCNKFSGKIHCQLSLLSNVSNVTMNKYKYIMEKWIISFVE